MNNDVVIGADDGKGILKITMTIIPKELENEDLIPEEVPEDINDNIGETYEKRAQM